MIAFVPSAGVRVVPQSRHQSSLNRGMQLNRVAESLSPVIADGTVLKESDYLTILGMTFDPMVTFLKHLSFVSRAAAQKLVIISIVSLGVLPSSVVPSC